MLLAGQIFGGMLISHYGLLGSPVQPVTLTNLAGALLMLGGVLLATRSDEPLFPRAGRRCIVVS